MSSSGKVEVLWSPTEDNTFITCGSAINLYQVDGPSNPHFTKHPESSLKVADQRYAVHCAVNSEIHFIKCLAWYPNPVPKNLLAVGQANGRVVLTSFGDPGDDELIGKEFVPRHARQCNYLVWNPAEPRFLAEGMEKGKNDPCIVVWDVTASHGHSESTERTRYSSSDHSSISKSYAEIGLGETSCSLAWYDDRTVLTGMNNRCLRLYDIHNPSKVRLQVQHRTVHGVCVDTHNKNRIASFGESQVAVWDIRHFDRPIITLQEIKPVSKISWCPTRPGVLTVMCKESASLRLYDIGHAYTGNDRDETISDIEPLIINRSVQPCGEHILSSFAWHPKTENRLLAAAGPSHIKDLVVFERVPMAWSPNFKYLTWVNGKQLITCQYLEQTDQQDICTRMKSRALKGYGMQCADMHANAIVVADEPHLRTLWKWISLVRQPSLQKGLVPPKRGSVYNMGVKQILKYYNEQSNPMSSDLVYVNWQPTDNSNFSLKHQYRSNERTLALSLCGWVQDTHADFSDYLNGLKENGEEEKAAAIAIFFLKMKKALDILSSSHLGETGNGKLNLHAVAMALAGYREDGGDLWRQTCSTQRFQLSSPYLRAIFAFLASPSHLYHDVLSEKMSVEDRVGFALTYLPDQQLKEFINQLAAELVAKGNLDGMLLTGLSSEGMDLLENYVDHSSDIQTAAITCVFSGTAHASKDERVSNWISSYRNLLNRWALWHHRVRFDIVSQQCESSQLYPPHVYINCNFCGKSITSRSMLGGLRSPTDLLRQFVPQRSPASQKHKITCCPNCRKALPRCAVCLASLGTASTFSPETEQLPAAHSAKPGVQRKLTPFQDWFAWCQTCRHGGHASHITQWFKDHPVCPVTGCTCRCYDIDANDKVASDT